MSGNGLDVSTTSFRDLPSTLGTGTWWISILAQSTTPGNQWGGVSLFNGTTEQLFIGQRFNAAVWGLESGGGISTTASSGTVSLIVVKLVLGVGTDSAVMWGNPALSGTPSDASGVSFANFADINPNRLRIASGTSFHIDEVRIGDNFDVVASGIPELDITRGGTAVVDGSSEIVPGTVAGSAQSLTYVLTNSGTASLGVTVPVTVAGATNCTATVTAQPGTTIASGATSTLAVSVTPMTAAAWSFTLSVVNTDANENPYNWTVSGTASAVPAPELDMTRGTAVVADAGTDSVSGTVAGSAQSLTYVLTNSGTASLGVTVPVTVAGATNCTATVTTQPSTTIASGATGTLVVSVTPTTASAWSFTLSVANTDANENPYNWTVSGTASAVPAPELDVTRGAAAVADAGTDSVRGTVAGSAQSLTYVLTNSGTASLGVTVPVTVAGATNCTATVTAQPGTTIASGATSTLVVSVTPTTASAWSFTLSVVNTDANENPYNWTVSGTASAVLLPPVIVTQPPSTLTVVEGSDASFTVVASGSGLVYQWQINGTNITGATGATYLLPAVSLAMDGSVFTVVVSGSAGPSVTTTGTTLFVTAVSLAIISQPKPVSIRVGETADFSVVATGSSLTYQWRRNGVAIPGATAASYHLMNVQLSDSGAVFTVVVSNLVTSVTSDLVTLTVLTAAETRSQAGGDGGGGCGAGGLTALILASLAMTLLRERRS